ncbi:MAG: hypothetical protein LQ340_007717 [Diploschistes diacapsis]|nr:MAG: hypothetical protein LQ340_007717 [Diploschistes diacapsis]
MELPIPIPEVVHEAYNLERVCHARAYAEERLRSTTRKVTPITETFLTVYRSACDAWLSASENGFKGTNRLALVREIRDYEAALNDRLWLKALPTDDKYEQTQDLATARKEHMYARYGDYLARICHDLRITSEANQNPGHERIGARNRWTDIGEKVQAQAQKRKQNRWMPTGMLTAQFPELYAVERAAKDAGLDVEQCVWAVINYGKRNQMMHRDLDNMLAAGHFNKLAATLHSDLADVPNVIDRSLQQERIMIIGIIETLVGRWFKTERHTFEFNDPETWSARDEIEDHSKLKKEIAQAQEEAKKEHDKKQDKLRDRKEKEEAKYEQIKLQMVSYVSGQLQLGLKMPTQRKSPARSQQERIRMFKAVDSLGAKAAKTYKWSMKREKQNRELMVEMEALRKELESKQTLIDRYQTERSRYLAQAVGQQQQSNRRAREYLDAGFYSPPGPSGYAGVSSLHTLLPTPAPSLGSSASATPIEPPPSYDTLGFGGPAPNIGPSRQPLHPRAPLPRDLYLPPKNTSGPPRMGFGAPQNIAGPPVMGFRVPQAYVPPHRRPGYVPPEQQELLQHSQQGRGQGQGQGHGGPYDSMRGSQRYTQDRGQQGFPGAGPSAWRI